MPVLTTSLARCAPNAWRAGGCGKNCLVSELRVELRAPTEVGRLYSSYDARVDVLTVGSAAVRSWPLGLNVDSTIIFDLAADRRLANIDVVVPRRRWRTHSALGAPAVWLRADLAFEADAVAQTNFALPVSIAAADNKTRVLILFGRPRPDARAGVPDGARAVALSERCLALVRDSILVGLYVELPQPW